MRIDRLVDCRMVGEYTSRRGLYYCLLHLVPGNQVYCIWPLTFLCFACIGHIYFGFSVRIYVLGCLLRIWLG